MFGLLARVPDLHQPNSMHHLPGRILLGLQRHLQLLCPPLQFMLPDFPDMHQLSRRLLPAQCHLPALSPHLRHLFQRLSLPVLHARLLLEQQLMLCLLIALPDLPRKLDSVCELPHRLPTHCHVHLHSMPTRLPRLRPHLHLLRLLVWVHSSQELFRGHRIVLLPAMPIKLLNMHK